MTSLLYRFLKAPTLVLASALLAGGIFVSGCGGKDNFEHTAWLHAWSQAESKLFWNDLELTQRHLEVHLTEDRTAFDIVAHLTVNAINGGATSVSMLLDAGHVSLVQQAGVPLNYSYADGHLEIEWPNEINKGESVNFDVIYRVPATGDTSVALVPAARYWSPQTGPIVPATIQTDLYLPNHYTGAASGSFIRIEKLGTRNMIVWNTFWASPAGMVVGPFATSIEKNMYTEIAFFLQKSNEAMATSLVGHITSILDVYNAILGGNSAKYPFKKLAIVEVPETMPQMVSASLVFVTTAELAGHDAALARILAYRIARQWWGCAVPTIGLPQDWWADGMARYFSALWVEIAYGDESYRAILANEALEHLDSLAALTTEVDMMDLIRGDDPHRVVSLLTPRAVWMWHQLRHAVGKGAFAMFCQSLVTNRLRGGTDIIDLATAMRDATGSPNTYWLARWIATSKLPAFELKSDVTDRDGTFHVEVSLASSSFHRFPVEIAATVDGNVRIIRSIRPGATASFDVRAGEPELVIDPDNWVLRTERRKVYESQVARVTELW